MTAGQFSPEIKALMADAPPVVLDVISARFALEYNKGPGLHLHIRSPLPLDDVPVILEQAVQLRDWLCEHLGPPDARKD